MAAPFAYRGTHIKGCLRLDLPSAASCSACQARCAPRSALLAHTLPSLSQSVCWTPPPPCAGSDATGTGSALPAPRRSRGQANGGAYLDTDMQSGANQATGRKRKWVGAGARVAACACVRVLRVTPPCCCGDTRCPRRQRKASYVEQPIYQAGTPKSDNGASTAGGRAGRGAAKAAPAAAGGAAARAVRARR